ncbi:unnamed protein product [Ceutorhynchus assimilis]|uniref:F-box domain-containing protein n=1 Tax=Ceutorhynchus assimilis TaxID=467358 RepID=A0A9N9QE91_9CUCU|nr:unnamed protein product [Ceutorhynchus assimilis]
MAENNNSKMVISDTDIPQSSGYDLKTKSSDKTENVLRTYLLEEYKPDACPESLQNLLTCLENHAHEVPGLDTLAGLIFLIMAESGFVPIDYNGPDKSYDFHYNRMMTISKNPRIRWSSDGIACTLKFKLCDLEQFEIKLILISHSDDLIVTCFVKGLKLGNLAYELILDPRTYFVSWRTSLIRNLMLQNLDVLSFKIKDGIAFPIKCAILQQNGVPLPCLANLPLEILWLISRKLSGRDLSKFSKVINNWFK